MYKWLKLYIEQFGSIPEARFAGASKAIADHSAGTAKLAGSVGHSQYLKFEFTHFSGLDCLLFTRSRFKHAK